MLKRTLVILWSIMALTLAACGQTTPSAPTAAPPAGEQPTAAPAAPTAAPASTTAPTGKKSD